MKKNHFLLLRLLMSGIHKLGSLILLVVLFTEFQDALAQPFDKFDQRPLRGLPGISHYNREDFHADPQFWAVCEDKEGVLYFGNNDGAVIFDGERWHKVHLPNNSSIRCLTTDEKGNVYAGGFNDFGLIQKDVKGKYFYKSLFDTLKFEDQNLENLWQVHAIGEAVIYRSFSKLILITGNKATKLPAKSTFVRSYVVNGEFYVQDRDHGIFLLDMNRLQFISHFKPDQYEHEEIVALLPSLIPQQSFGIAKSGEVFKFDFRNRSSRRWKSLFKRSENDQVECAIQANDSTYYVGTLGSGIITIDNKGHIYKEEQNFQELQDKTVLNLFRNTNGNLWALLNNGLDCINFNSPVTTLFENASLYDVLIEGDKMYLATNQGIFYTDSVFRTRPEFKKLGGMEGQGWSLQRLAGDILASHDKGLFQINGTQASKIGEMNGIWKIIEVKEKKGLYLAASYHGLHLLERSPTGDWLYHHKIEGFNESSRDILETDIPGTYWVCHGYKGVFRINIDDSYKHVTSLEHFTTQNGFKFPYSINVFAWKNKTVFTTNDGIYTYNNLHNRFEPYAALNDILNPSKNTRRLLQYEDKTWFIQDDEVGFFETGGQSLNTEYFLQFKGDFNRGMECIVPLPNDQVLLGTKTGLYLFDLKYRDSDKEVNTVITGIRYTAGQEIQSLLLSPVRTKAVALPNHTTLLRFEFASPAMQNDADIQYSYKLEGIDDQWSLWQNASHAEFNHLRPGSYAFTVKSRSLLGMEGAKSTYHFEILPVWYQTSWAWIIYFVIVSLIIVLLAYLIKRKIAHENNKTREEEQNTRKLLELELQQMRLRSEKEKISIDKELLEEDVIYKSKELANYTMLLVKKREVISQLRQDLKELKEIAKNEGSRKKVREMISKISQHMVDEEYLQVFEANFEKVHQDFFNQLKSTFPDLTQKELRLCAFVKMNLTNKEIAPMLNISVRGVETARYRIRKKLNLEHENNLVEYLEDMSPNSGKHVADNSLFSNYGIPDKF